MIPNPCLLWTRWCERRPPDWHWLWPHHLSASLCLWVLQGDRCQWLHRPEPSGAAEVAEEGARGLWLVSSGHLCVWSRREQVGWWVSAFQLSEGTWCFYQFRNTITIQLKNTKETQRQRPKGTPDGEWGFRRTDWVPSALPEYYLIVSPPTKATRNSTTLTRIFNRQKWYEATLPEESITHHL